MIIRLTGLIQKLTSISRRLFVPVQAIRYIINDICIELEELRLY